jgi:hypothetical protein
MWECTQISASTSICQATSTPLFIQDSGGIVFGLSIIIFLMSMIFWGLWNNKLLDGNH